MLGLEPQAAPEFSSQCARGQTAVRWRDSWWEMWRFRLRSSGGCAGTRRNRHTRTITLREPSPAGIGHRGNGISTSVPPPRESHSRLTGSVFHAGLPQAKQPRHCRAGKSRPLRAALSSLCFLVPPCVEPQPPRDPASSPGIEGRDPLERSEPVFREGQKRNMRKEERQKRG